MTKNDTDFENWYSTLQLLLLDHGIEFRDETESRQDYDAGRGLHDVADEIKAEYDCGDEGD